VSAAPLSGVRVLDLSRFVAGPLSTFFLASLGAEVLAVETPVPSTSRRMPPFAATTGGGTSEYHDGALALPFLKRFRGKRSLAIDITRPDGQRVIRALADQSDVVVENSKPGTMESFGLGYDELRRTNAGLVYCAITGYGQQDHERAAMDNIVQALSGVMARTGFPDGPPVRAGFTVADHTTAVFAALGVVASLRQRDQTGTGQLVDVAMLDVLTAFVWDEPIDHYDRIGLPVRTGNADGRGAPINAYRCADGWVCVTCTSEAQFQRLCTLMERPDLLERFPDFRSRAAGARELDAEIESWTSTRPAREVEAAWISIGFPTGRVRDPFEARDDPAIRARALFEELRHPDAPDGKPSGFVGARLPIAFEGRVDLAPAETLGKSTDAVLRELGVCTDEQLAQLRSEGVIA
jgi:formyl-CoA transferase